MDKVASTPRCAATTTWPAVGSNAAADPAQTRVAPQATSPNAAAARKVSGTDGGGTAPGSPGGRPGQEAAAGCTGA